MLVDARQIPSGSTIDADVCVIGAGAAGITLAREWIGAPFRVALLESGGLAPDADTQSLYAGPNTGFPYFELDRLRLRYFGGTTNHWTGSCRPLDPIDFEARDWVPRSGWPFGRAHLDPFYARAHELCQIGPFDYTLEPWENGAPRLPFRGGRVTTAIHRRSPPTRFGEVYGPEVERAGNVQAILYANVVEIGVTENAAEATRVEVATLTGNRFAVRSRIFVLATGALENARLLLASSKVVTAGLGNQNDLVGRFFMEHLNAQSAVFLPCRPDLNMEMYWPTTEERLTRAGHARGFLAFSPETLRAEKLLCFRTFLKPDLDDVALAVSSDGLRRVATRYRSAAEDPAAETFLGHVHDVITDLDQVAIASYLRLFRKPLPFFMQFQLEQVPNPESRVSLIDERDRLGMRRIQLAWRFTELERRSLERARALLAAEVGAAGLGRVRLLPDDPASGWPSVVRPLLGTWHQMGTTRMHADPKQGVVDPDCRVHGTSNLYVAGSSVFPTSGYANPTLTIVALAVRLAQHVRGELRG